MFQEMINGSIAVLTKPSVATFEEHEKNNLTWALIYSVIAGVINAILAGIAGALRPAISPTDLEGIDPALAEQFAQAGSGSIVGAVIGTLIFTPIFLLIGWGIVYGLGRAFGGTGQFGELAFDLSLFNAPTSVIGSVLNLIPVIGPIAAFVLGIYNLYLTYLAIQSGMNLPSQKALYVILILAAIFLLIFCGIFGVALLALLGASSLSQ
jgi:MFS family permease